MDFIHFFAFVIKINQFIQRNEVKVMDLGHKRIIPKEGITVLSLFDGISCGRIALERAGIKVNKYYASEIKATAIKVTQQHYPDTIQIGDVTKVSYKNGILYTENGNYNIGNVDLLIGGSPCTEFSYAKILDVSKQKQEGLKGKNSKLFYEYLRILRECNSTYFLLENVKMKKSDEQELNRYLGVNGLHINSSLVSYQVRERIYWTNIPEVKVPEDRHINFQDYKETDYNTCLPYKAKYQHSSIQMWNNGKGRVPAFKGDNTSKYCENVTSSEKIRTITARQDRSPNSGLIEFDGFYRYLTRKEIELAQTLPIGYTNYLSYRKMQDVVGNGWTVDIIAHIFSFMDFSTEI